MDVKGTIDSLLPEYLTIFKELVAINSVAATNLDGCVEAAEYLRGLLRDRGFKVELWGGYGSPVVHASIDGDGDPFFIYNHYDVQPPDPLDRWRSDPFKLSRDGDKLVGRGVADNKGNIVARLMAIDLFRERYGDYPIEWIIEGEEEVGSPNLERILVEHRSEIRGGSGLWETGYVRRDGRLEFPLGYKGMVYLEVEVSTLLSDSHSGYAPILPNPFTILAEKILDLKDSNGVLKKGFLVEGVSREYIEMASEMLEEIPPSVVEETLELYGVPKSMWIAPETAIERLYLNPSINVSGFKAGYILEGSKTIVPSKAVAKIDFRPLPGQNVDHILNMLKRHFAEGLEGGVRIKVYGKYRSGYTRRDAKIVGVAVDAGVEAYGKPPLVTPISPGSGPIYLFTDLLGIELAGAGVGYYGSRAHAPNENIRVDDFKNGVYHVYRMLERYFGAV